MQVEDKNLNFLFYLCKWGIINHHPSPNLAIGDCPPVCLTLTLYCMYNVFVVGFEPEYSYVEADLDFATKSEAEDFARRYSDDYSVAISWVEN